MAGRHIVIVPAWWPSPEQPINGIFFQDYVRAFAAAGARVGVIYPDLVSIRHLFGPTSKNWFPRIVEEAVDECPVIRIRGLHSALRMPGLQMRRYRAWLWRGLAVYRARYGEPDLLHAMCAIPAGWACTTLNDPLASRVVITEHTGPFSLVMSPYAGESFVRSALAAAARVVAVSEPLREEMQKAGISGKLDVVGNPVSEEFTPFAPPVVEKVESGGVSFRGLFVGRLTALKGVPELIEAAVQLKKKSAFSVTWHFAGDGPLQGEIQRRFESAGLRDKLRLHGLCERSRVAALLRESHFLVLPSHGENCPLAICEALSAGRPVVASDVPGCKVLIGQGDGVIGPVRNASALADAIVRLVEDYAAWDWQAIAARAAARFSPKVIAARYAEIFRSVTAVPKASGQQVRAGRSAKMES